MQLQTLQALAMAQHQRRAIVAAGAAASILLYFYKRRQPPDGRSTREAVPLDENECKTLETLLRDLLKNGAQLPGKTYSPVTHPNFV